MTSRQRRILAIEVAAADALPPRERVDDDGWRLRFNAGVTRRGNSVFAGDPGADPLEAKITRAESFYRARNAVPRFQLTAASQPLELAQALIERRYGGRPGALVQTLDLASVDLEADVDGRELGALVVTAEPTAAWLDALGAGSPEPEGALAVRASNLRAVVAPKAFVAVRVEGATAAVGFVAVSGAWAGVFNMATVPAWRRRGMGRRVLLALASHARRQGATTAYLQVHPDNLGAQALYASLGFVTHHRYDYWEPSD